MPDRVRGHGDPSGLPKESGYTTGFAVMAAGLARAALAGLRAAGPLSGTPALSARQLSKLAPWRR